MNTPAPHVPGFTIVSHAGNIKWLAFVTVGFRAILPAATLFLMGYTIGPVWRCIKAVWNRQCPNLTDIFAASLFSYAGHLGLGFFGKRVYFAITEGRSLGYDSGPLDQWTSAYFLFGGSMSALLGVWAVSRFYGHARYAVPAMIAFMLFCGVGFAFLYAWQQGAL